MIVGRITDHSEAGYDLLLENGQSLRLPDKYLPESLRLVGQKINLIFGGGEDMALPESEIRALLNNLLS